MFALGRQVTKTIGGKHYTFSRLERRIVEEFRDWIAECEGDPFAEVKALLGQLDSATAKAMIEEAKLTKQQLHAFSLACPLAKRYLTTELGLGQLFYLMLRQHHQDITPDEAFVVATTMAAEESERVLQQTQGTPPPEKNAPAPAA